MVDMCSHCDRLLQQPGVLFWGMFRAMLFEAYREYTMSPMTKVGLTAMGALLVLPWVAVAQSVPAVPTDVALTVPSEVTTAVPWISTAFAVVSIFLMILREFRATVERLHDCQPTFKIELVHSYSDGTHPLLIGPPGVQVPPGEDALPREATGDTVKKRRTSGA